MEKLIREFVKLIVNIKWRFLGKIIKLVSYLRLGIWVKIKKSLRVDLYEDYEFNFTWRISP